MKKISRRGKTQRCREETKRAEEEGEEESVPRAYSVSLNAAFYKLLIYSCCQTHNFNRCDNKPTDTPAFISIVIHIPVSRPHETPQLVCEEPSAQGSVVPPLERN